MSVAMMGSGGGGSSTTCYSLENIIPAMSSNSQDGYTVSIAPVSGSNSCSGEAYYIFNQNCYVYNFSQDGWAGNGCHFGSTQDGRIDIKLPEPKAVHCAFIIGPNYELYGVNGPQSAELYYSDDGSNYIAVSNATNIRNNSYAQLPALSLADGIKICPNPGKHKYYRIIVRRSTAEFVGVNAILLV